MVLAEYLAIRDTLLLFGVRADWEQPEVVSIPIDQSELAAFVEANFTAHHRIRHLIDMGFDELWHRYDYLIGPVARWAAPDDIVCLVPHGWLHYLPLHALKLEGSYLIERNAVVYGPSASVLKHCQTNRKLSVDSAPAHRTAAIFGDSRENLPAARAEAMMLGELFGIEPVLGKGVTREAFLQMTAGVDIVHFAGHAEFSSTHALESGLHLAGSDILTAGEIFGLDEVHAYLIALSGCETGVNQNRPGDELIGLTRAFLYARAASVLVSLWQVSDESTAFLMSRFYTYLRDDLTILKVDALRRAMLDTKAQPSWASFYHWAPFTLIGDWR